MIIAKKILNIAAFLLLTTIPAIAQATDTVHVRENLAPILIEREDNVLFRLRVNGREGQNFNHIALDFGEGCDMSAIKSVKLYYSGTDARQDAGKFRFAPVEYIHRDKTLAANPSYSVLVDEVKHPSRRVSLGNGTAMFPGVNYFWVSIKMKQKAKLDNTFKCHIESVTIDGKKSHIKMHTPGNIVHRMGVGVRHAGDDGSAAYRIPGIVTTDRGTLLGVYDVRYNSSVDLQEHIDIGLSRSTDGGKSWEKMRIPMSFGQDSGLPSAQNGVGDPSILFDPHTRTTWIIAAWTHGMGNQRAWWSSHPGMEKKETAQLVICKSTDDGKTWSKPINITEQVKLPEWYFLLQGPGMGITMQDGTLVFPIQFIGADRIPCAGIMYSKDSGKTWAIHSPARSNTTESQVAEVSPGVLMLNMRDNRGGSRAVCTTSDLGRTWQEHESSRNALIEPVCMASLISVKAKDNILGRDILLFSNPNSTNSRSKITIKMSLDGGKTWPENHQIMLDGDNGWGYSCLTRVDKETVGILYESSVAHMTFQTVKLQDLLGESK